MKNLFLLFISMLLSTVAFSQDYKAMLAKELKAANFDNASAILGFDLDPGSPAGMAYDKMMDAFMANGEKRLGIIKKYADNFKNITPSMAKELTNDMLKVEKDRLKLMNKMSKTMGKHLSPQNTLALLQYQSKKHAIISEALARMVPFANQ